MKFKATRTVRPEPMRGLGDAVHAVAKPVARVLDRVFATHWANCETCEERRRKLNEAVPFKP